MQLVQQPSTRVTQAFGPASGLGISQGFDAASPLLHSKQYRIVEQLGEGGMGTVYRAYDPMLERDVAIKVLKDGLPKAARRRFLAEARHGARMGHPHLVRVFDLGVQLDTGLDWFAMEFLDGRDLDTLLQRASRRELRLPARLVGIVFDQMLDALGHAHDAGVIHRDVKPANVFVARGRARDTICTKLLDFGVALESGDEDGSRELCGDPRYVAPEQALGEPTLDHRADLYAAGMSLYESLAGHHPFESLIDRGTAALLQAQCDRPLPSLFDALPITWPETTRRQLDEVVHTACAKDPQARFPNAEVMRRAIRNALRVRANHA